MDQVLDFQLCFTGLFVWVPKSYCPNYYSFLMSAICVISPALLFLQFVLAILGLFHSHVNFRIKFSTYSKKVLNFVLYLRINRENLHFYNVFTIYGHGIALLLFISTLIFLSNSFYLHIFLLDLFLAKLFFRYYYNWFC